MATESKVDENLYSRQIGVFGMETCVSPQSHTRSRG